MGGVMLYQKLIYRVSLVALALALAAAMAISFVPLRTAYAQTIGGGWTAPLSTMPSLSSGFLADSCSPNNNYLSGEYHIGNDYGASVGSPVYAIGQGTVIYIGSFGEEWANAIFVQHQAADGSNFIALYGHINVGISTGAAVTAGQQIGTIADIEFDHLHFGIRPGTTYPSNNWGKMACPTTNGTNGFVDPMPYLTAHPSSGAAQQPAGNLLQIENPGNGWSAYNLSSIAGNVQIKGKPGALWTAGGPNIFAADSNGALRQFTLCPNGGWCTYKITGDNALAGGVEVIQNPSGNIEVFGPSTDGSLLQIEFAGGGWSVYNLTSAAGGIHIKGAPGAYWDAGGPNILTVDSNGALRQFTLCPAGGWCTYQITANNVFAGGVNMVKTATAIEAFATSTGNHLYQIENPGTGWSVYDVTNFAGGVEVKGEPGVLWGAGGPNVFISDTTGRLRQFTLCATGGGWCTYPITGPNALAGGVDVLHNGSAIEVFAVSQ